MRECPCTCVCTHVYEYVCTCVFTSVHVRMYVLRDQECDMRYEDKSEVLLWLGLL